jgi:hypothetical protein
VKLRKPENAELLKESRRRILDLLEGSIGDHPKWSFIRSRVLQIFGRDGLEKILHEDTDTDDQSRNGTDYETFSKI